jgi:hypothetical protein
VPPRCRCSSSGRRASSAFTAPATGLEHFARGAAGNPFANFVAKVVARLLTGRGDPHTLPYQAAAVSVPLFLLVHDQRYYQSGAPPWATAILLPGLYLRVAAERPVAELRSG